MNVTLYSLRLFIHDLHELMLTLFYFQYSCVFLKTKKEYELQPLYRFKLTRRLLVVLFKLLIPLALDIVASSNY